jgi:hypothetical protein
MGGKGIGRFIWLKAFSAVNVESVFSEGDDTYRRGFAFRAQEPPIQEHSIEPLDEDASLATTVSLVDLRDDYRAALPSNHKVIAKRLVRHLLVYLLDPTCPKIILRDEASATVESVNELFQTEFLASSEQHRMRVRNHEIDVRFLRVIPPSAAEHAIVLCADQREVSSYPLHRAVPEAKGISLESSDNEAVELRVIVGGEYLDGIVSPERTTFLFPDSETLDVDAFDITLEQLLEAVGNLVRIELKDALQELERTKIVRIERFVREKEPEYRVLLKHARPEIASIPPDVSDVKLDQELHKILHTVEAELKEEGRAFIGVDVEAIDDIDTYKDQYRQYVEKLLDYRSSELAKYVIHRRTIIELLGKAISLNSIGKYALEEDVHRILYPPRTTSDDLEFGQQNLWLIDEKLTYHYFLASDTAMSKMRIVESDSMSRPDVLIFDQPSAFVEGEYPLLSVVVI